MKTIALALVACLTVLAAPLPARPEAPSPAEPAASPAPLPGRIRIEVLSQLGKPIPEARVVFYRQPGPDEEPLDPCGSWEGIVPEAVSPGIFAEEVRPGTYRIEAAGEEWIGAVEEKVEVNSGETRELQFRLEPGLAISGRVSDEEGNPLSDVKASYHLPGTQAVIRLRSRGREVVSDPSGWFAFRDLSPAVYNLKFSRSGYVPDRISGVAAGTSGLEVKMKKGFTIRGRLEGDLEDLDPSVYLELKSGKWKRDFRRVDLGPGHSFELDNLERKSYTVQAQHMKHLFSRPTAPVEALPPEEARPIIIRVFRGGSLSGRVTEAGSGAPLPGVHLQLIPDGSKMGDLNISDDQGGFSFLGLDSGEYTLKARLWLDEYDKSRLERKVAVEPGEEVSGYDLELEAGRLMTVSGTVLDEKGFPVEGAEVRLSFLAPGERSRWQDSGEKAGSDSAGEFSHSVFLADEGEIALNATKEGYGPAERKFELSGQPAIGGVTLVLDRGSTLEIQVGEGEGGRSSVPGAIVVLRTDFRAKRGARRSVDLRKLTDALGRCRFENLAPGAYRIEVSKSGYVTAKEKVGLEEAEPVQNLSLVLERGRTLLIRVEDERGEAVEGAELDAREMTGGYGFHMSGMSEKNQTNSSGVGLIRDLPSGPLSLRVQADGYVTVNRHRVEEDQDEITVVMKSAGSIRGRFLGDGGRPLADLNIITRKRTAGPLDFEPGFFNTEELGDGVFRVVRLAPGVYDLTIRSDGRAGRKIEAVEVEAGGSADLGEVVLGPESAISGRVRAEDGSPLEGAWVRIETPGEGMISLFTSPGRSAPDGSFSIDGLSSGTFTLTATAKGYRPERIPGVTVGIGEAKEIPDLRLARLTEAEKEQLKQRKNIIPSLGVRIREPEPPEDSATLELLLIEEVLPGTAAEKSGLAAGDAIVKINGKSISEEPMEFFQGLMAAPGTEIKITVKRGEDGREEELDLTIDQWNLEELLRLAVQED